MTPLDVIRRVIENKDEQYVLPVLPPADPGDFYVVRGEEELEDALSQIDRRERLTAIEDALRDPFMDKQTAFTLLEEMAEIQISLDKE
jgi:hypothetical protein